MVELKLLLEPFKDSMVLASINGIDNLTITPDLAVAEGDDPEVVALKKAQRMKILHDKKEFYEGILSLKNDQRFKNLESLSLQLIKNIDQRQIWEAIKSGNQAMFNSLVCQRVGIVTYAMIFESIRGKVEQAIAEIEKLLPQSADDQPTVGPNYNDLQE